MRGPALQFLPYPTRNLRDRAMLRSLSRCQEPVPQGNPRVLVGEGHVGKPRPKSRAKKNRKKMVALHRFLSLDEGRISLVENQVHYMIFVYHYIIYIALQTLMDSHPIQNPSLRILMQLTPSQIRSMQSNTIIGKLGLTDALTHHQLQQCIWQCELLSERLARLDDLKTHQQTMKNILSRQKNNESKLHLYKDSLLDIQADNDYLKKTISNLGVTIEKRDATIVNREEVIAAHTTTINTRDRTIRDLNDTIEGQTRTIAQRDTTITQLNRRITQRRDQDNCWRCFFVEKSRGMELGIAIIFTIIVNLVISSVAAVDTEVQRKAKFDSQIGIGIIGVFAFVSFWVWVYWRTKLFSHFLHT